MKVAVMGDIAARGQEDRMNEAFGREALAELLPYLEGTDLRIANWENPTTRAVTPIPKSGPALHSRPENVGFLKAAGVNLAILANNHTGDMGPEGVLETLSCLRGEGIGTVGAGAGEEEAAKPFVFEKNGETLTVLAVCEHEFGLAAGRTPGTSGYDHIRLRRQIQAAKQASDFVLVIAHGGNEFCPIPNPRKAAQFRDLALAGADAVIGMHPHCPQGFEMAGGSAIVYSTGNFFFLTDAPGKPLLSWQTGYLPLLTFSRTQGTHLEVVPYQFDFPCTKVIPLTGQPRDIMTAYLKKLGAPLGNPEQLHALWDGWCLKMGPGFCSGLSFQQAYAEGFRDQHLYDLKNLFNCEAHCAVVSRYLQMAADGTLKEAGPWKQQIEALQQIPVSVI